jgi:hypothetical protein
VIAVQAVLLDGGAVAEKQGGGLKTPLEHDDTYTSAPPGAFIKSHFVFAVSKKWPEITSASC